jgi:arsenate reductase
MRGKTRVLFLCTHNSARSQMAETYMRSIAGDRYEIASAGTEPSRVHPLAIRAMQEIGIDIAHQSAKPFLGDVWHYVITVCDQANESCPIFPFPAQRLHWGLPDPSQATGTEDERLQVFRWVRDKLFLTIRAWLAEQEEQHRSPGQGAARP